jgi:peptidyl-prolyl cis-trans isomerase A (cyclophilin A)
MKVKVISSCGLLIVASLLSSTLAAQTIVCAETNLDTFCMELMQGDAPFASTRFLSNVDAGLYNKSLIHRSVQGPTAYLSAGAYQAALEPTVVAAPVTLVNEFSAANAAFTVAFEINAGQPNTINHAWRINVSDNSAAFPSSANSGAVFAKVLEQSKPVVTRLSKLSVHGVNNAHLSAAPFLQLDNKVTVDDLVQIKRVYRYAGTLDDFNTHGVNFPAVDPTKPVSTEVACLDTNQGEFCMRLFKNEAPNTVANFLKYVNDGDYNNSVFHRLVKGFVLQGGGYKFVNNAVTEVPDDPPVINEFNRSNLRGTVAMAKLDGNPNSATSEFFVNLGSNTGLDSLNGGFTVFAEVVNDGMTVVDKIAALPISNDSARLSHIAFNEVPLVNNDQTRSADDFVTINRAYVTQRDVVPPTVVSKGPLGNIVAMGTYTSGMLFPVRVGGKLYQMLITGDDADGNTTNADDPDLFSIDTTRIIQLIDNGRISATYANQTLTIPTIRIGDVVYVNVVLKLADASKLTFRLQSFDKI